MTWHHDACWEEHGACAVCGRSLAGGATAAPAPPPRALARRLFRSSWSSWEQLCQEVADAATQAGPARVAAVCHSCDQNEGVIVLWTWKDPSPVPPRFPERELTYRVFRSSWSSWEALFDSAAGFVAKQVRPGRLLAISHSEDKNDGVIVVWFWA
jgi:hypothetical protein